MKAIYTTLLLAGALYLSSCTDNSKSNFLPVIPKSDSVTDGGTLQISFNGESFYEQDFTVRNSPVFTSTIGLQATDINDTAWIGQFQMTDHKSKTVSLNLTGYYFVPGGGGSDGTYVVTANNSTVTDFSLGENRVYAVQIGSTITITSFADTTFGTLALNLYYDHTYYPATGSFKVPKY